MEEAIVDVALDLNLLSSERFVQPGEQGDTITNNQDHAQLPAGVQKGYQASSRWSEKRAAWVETLRVTVAAGAYRIDSAELALCILRNSTHFLETH